MLSQIFLAVALSLMVTMTSADDFRAVIATYSLPCQTMFEGSEKYVNMTNSCQSELLVFASQNFVKVGFCTEAEFNNLTMTVCKTTFSQSTSVSEARKNFYEALSKTTSKCRKMAYSCIATSPVSIVSKQQEKFCSLMNLNINGQTSERCLISADNTGCTQAEVNDLKTAACRVNSTSVDQTFSTAVLSASTACHNQMTTCANSNGEVVMQIVMGKYCDVINLKSGTLNTEVCLKTGNACTAAEFDKFKDAACSHSPGMYKTFSFITICLTLVFIVLIQM